jgi:hypothetical protein
MVTETRQAEVLELVQNALIIYSDRAPLAVAGILWSDESAIREFGRTLTIRYLVRLINAERRRKFRPKQQQLPLFPGLDHLPQRIVTPEGKRPLLAKSTATEIRAYVKGLNRKHRERIEQLQTVLQFMGKYIRNNRGITAAEVANLEASR